MPSVEDELNWRRACERVSIRFANAIDHRDYPAVLDLFAEDGTLDRLGTRFTGRAALSAWLESRPTNVVTRHVCTNIDIEPSGPSRASGITYFTYYKAEGAEGQVCDSAGPDLVGEYHDSFVLTLSGWKILERKVMVVFQRPAQTSAATPKS
jgi:hypothetical protein